jgi:hypothetical protein
MHSRRPRWYNPSEAQSVLKLRLARRMAGLVAVALFVCGCNQVINEAPSYSLRTWNDSSTDYFVMVTAKAGNHPYFIAQAHSIVYFSTGSAPRQAEVYDATCTTRFALLSYPDGVLDLVIDASGGISIPTKPLGDPTKADPSISYDRPMPSACDIFMQTRR